MLQVCFFLALVFCVLAVIFGITFLRRYNKVSFMIVLGFALAGFTLFFPLFHVEYDTWESVLLSILQTFKMFLIHGEYNELTKQIDPTNAYMYNIFLGVLHVLAPMFLTGYAIIVLAGQKLYSIKRYKLFAEKYVLSELNIKSLTLAMSIKSSYGKRWNRAVIIFCIPKGRECDEGLLEKVKKNRFVVMKKSADEIYNSNVKVSGNITFLVCAEKENENLDLSYKLMSKYKKWDNANFYVFSTDRQAELMIGNLKEPKQYVHIVNETQIMAYSLLDKVPLYSCLREEVPALSVLILGLGNAGTEILKSMIWCSRSYKYTSEFHIADIHINERISALRRDCPELDFGKYHIHYHETDLDINSHNVCEMISKNEHKYNYIVISTNNDDLNIKAALDLQYFFKRKDKHPVINVLIKDAVKSTLFKKQLANLKNSNNNFSNIFVFGCYEDIYLYNSIINDDLNKMAMLINLIYSNIGKDIDNKSVYNFRNAYEAWKKLNAFYQRSNMALALHLKYRLWDQGCTYMQADKKKALEYVSDVLKYDLLKYTQLEHERWVAFMLTEGWVKLDIERAKAINSHKVADFKQSACIADWDELIQLDEWFKDKNLIAYDENFVLQTQKIIEGGKDFGYSYKIIKLKEEKAHELQTQVN